MFREIVLILLSATALVQAQSPVPDFTPPTPLFRAVLSSDAAETKRLLASGADPNEGRFLGAPPLIVALMQHADGAARELIAGGADLKLTDPAGATALHWAATSEIADPEIVDLLIAKGVNVNAANKNGETALTWAMRRGYTPVVESLRKAGATDREMVMSSIRRSLDALQKSGPEFVKVSGCTSCHNQSLPQMAYSLAREKGIAVDAVIADKQAKSVIAMFKPFNEQMLQGKENIPDPAVSVSYSLVGLGAEGYKPDETTAAMAHLVAAQQLPDGGFKVFGARPPIESTRITATALSIRALQMYGQNADAKVASAREWLSSARARTGEELAMKLLGLAWAKADGSAITAAADALLAAQRQDGGWAQLPGLESDSYATGQALVALHVAGRLNAKDPAYLKGAGFLLRTQLPDGSWLVRTRSFPFQPYKESGYPHGKDQWISAAGASWATMALTLSLPPGGTQVSRLY